MDEDSSEPTTTSGDRMVSWARLQKVAAARDAAQERAEAAEARLAEHEKAAKSWERERKAWESTAAELDAYRAREHEWAMEREIMGAGITDPEGIDFARMAWQRVEEGKRPDGGVSAWLADRDSLPRAVRAYLESSGTEPPTAQRHDPNRGAHTSTTSTSRTFAAGSASRLAADGGWQAQRAAAWESLGVRPPRLPEWASKKVDR